MGRLRPGHCPPALRTRSCGSKSEEDLSRAHPQCLPGRTWVGGITRSEILGAKPRASSLATSSRLRRLPGAENAGLDRLETQLQTRMELVPLSCQRGERKASLGGLIASEFSLPRFSPLSRRTNLFFKATAQAGSLSLSRSKEHRVGGKGDSNSNAQQPHTRATQGGGRWVSGMERGSGAGEMKRKGSEYDLRKTVGYLAKGRV